MPKGLIKKHSLSWLPVLQCEDLYLKVQVWEQTSYRNGPLTYKKMRSISSVYIFFFQERNVNFFSQKASLVPIFKINLFPTEAYCKALAVSTYELLPLYLFCNICSHPGEIFLLLYHCLQKMQVGDTFLRQRYARGGICILFETS